MITTLYRKAGLPEEIAKKIIVLAIYELEVWTEGRKRRATHMFCDVDGLPQAIPVDQFEGLLPRYSFTLDITKGVK